MEREFMPTTYEGEPMQVTVLPRPLKALDGVTQTPEELEAQAQAAIASAEVYDQHTRGTCVDERIRIGLLDGSERIEARPSAAGGPNIYGLYVAELIGFFEGSDAEGIDRLTTVTQTINGAGIRSGGHIGCAANKSFNDVLGIIADSAEQIAEYAADNGVDVDPASVEEISRNAKNRHDSGVYADWKEEYLQKVLGDEAGEAIEKLADVPHEGKSVIREAGDRKTVNQTKLHEKAGQDSFVNTETYCERIEHAIAAGPEAVKMTRLARLSREAVLFAITQAVPNRELHQINLDLE